MVESYADLRAGASFDFIVVGSGFGGAVSALRLAQKGYSVAVIECGRHFRDEDFPKSNWRLDRYLWLPKLFLFGLQRLTLLKDVLILSGAGVGGGSLVYANTLLEPGEGFYASSPLGPLLRRTLAPHFKEARRMLGAGPSPRLFAADEALREVAAEMGRADTFSAVDVGVYFGRPGEDAADPYFGGQGPARRGCVFCGGCMVGCRHNAKNTLMKNYLHLALARGARIFSLTTATRVAEVDGGYELTVRRSGWGWGRKIIRGRHLVVSAGVLGTLRLLLEPSNRLPGLSPRVGRDLRTNSEVLLGATARSGAVDYSEGIAIASGMWPDASTHVEAARYPAGSDAMSLLAAREAPSAAALALTWLMHPRDGLRLLIPWGWARRSTILLCMQTLESRLRVSLKDGRLATALEEGSVPPPLDIPAARETLRRFAAKVDGIPQGSLAGTLAGVSTTAHILGGAVMARGPEEGVVDADGRAFGCRALWILDGSIIPANLGVNPSLTITALAERAMSSIPPA